MQKVKPLWQDQSCIVAAPGPNLTPEVAEQVRQTGWKVLVCQDAHRLLPWADVLYGCDDRWWDQYQGVPSFMGEKWSTHGDAHAANDKRQQAEKYGIHLVTGRRDEGFSLDPGIIHYGDNSGFQSINLAILLGATYIVLVGFNMGGRGHFFGDHPAPLFNQDDYKKWVPHFDRAAELLPKNITIINTTPNTELHSFRELPLNEAIGSYRMSWLRKL